jgi:hypothetical protein
MYRTLSNIIEMLVYTSVYLLISMMALKIVTTGLRGEHEKWVSEKENRLPLIAAALFIGIAIVVSAVIR